MSENIYWVYEGLIIDRDLVNKKIGEIVAHVKANEVGALAYEYCLNEDESMLTIYERYANNEAVLAHGENMQPYLYFFEDAVQVKNLLSLARLAIKLKSCFLDLEQNFKNL